MSDARVRFTALAAPIPERLEGDGFVLRPLTAADTPLDYAAVMASREFLRPWEQTGWPADDFTLEDDRADVGGLEERHRARHAFTYTVLDPAERECLGCVYLLPPDARTFDDAAVTVLDGQEPARYGAFVYFWVRTARLADGLDGRLLAALRPWLAREWDLGPVAFVTNEQVPQQVALLEGSGLRRRLVLSKAGQSGAFLAFA